MLEAGGVRWTPEQQTEAVKKITSDEQAQREAMMYLGLRVPEELDRIYQIAKKLNAPLSFWERVQTATWIYKTRQHLKGADLAKIATQRQKIRDGRTHTQADKLKLRMEEIDILKKQGKNWLEIRKYLKTEHRKQFQGCDLSPVAIRHEYYNWQKNL